VNIKAMLIEKERLAYIAGDLQLSQFFDDTLQYITELENEINEKDSKLDSIKTMQIRVTEILNEAQRELENG
jgi:hypothetical protein